MQKGKKSTQLFFNFQNLVVISLLVMLFTLNHFAYKYPLPPLYINMQKDGYQFNENIINTFSFGQKRMISSLLWVVTLMNLDLEHYKKKDLNSWPYLRFKLISGLDEKFYENYLYGAQYLSIVKNDLLGAEKLYEKGLKHYPDDYRMNFSAGYHFYFELNKVDLAIKYLKVAQLSNQAPVYLSSLIARMEAQRNNLQVAFNLLYNMYQSTAKGSDLRKHYHQRLYDVKTYIDLKCLNSGKAGCSRVDFDGNAYIKKSGKFTSIKPTSPIHVFKRK